MKKIFTLIFSIALLSTAFAQFTQKGQRENGSGNDVYASNDGRGYDKYDNRYDKPRHGNHGWYVFTPRERDLEIAGIHRKFDYRIRETKYNMFTGMFHKSRQIRFLEEKRDQEISAVIYKFKSPKNKFGDFGKARHGKW